MSVPTVVTVVQQHRAALLARETAAMQAQAQAWLRVETAIQTQVDALALELAQNPGRATMGQLSRSRRYQALMAQTRDELRRYNDYLEPQIISGQRNMMLDAITHSAQAVNAVATEAGVNVQFNRLNVQAVENMVGLAGDGSPLRDVLNDAARVGPDAMAQELVNGIALGRNPIDVARRAMRLGLGQSFTRMQAISRTEQLRTYRLTSLQSYQASSVVIAYKRLSARDRRTCPACLFADGQQYPIDHGFDEHPQGRCTMIPVLANVQPVQFQTGQEWFAEQDAAAQRAILGAGRFDLWQRGDVSQLENNVHEASRARMKMIAAALGVSLGFLELETDDPAPPQQDEQDQPNYFSPQADEAAQLIDAMDSDDWRNLALQVIQLLAMHAGSEGDDDNAPAPGVGGKLILGKLLAGLKKSAEANGEFFRRNRFSSE